MTAIRFPGQIMTIALLPFLMTSLREIKVVEFGGYFHGKRSGGGGGGLGRKVCL